EAEFVELRSPPEQRPRKGPSWGMAVVGMLVVGASVFAATWALREPAQTEASAQPKPVCAVEDPEQVLGESVVDVCRKIRLGQFEDAWDDWEAERSERFGQDDVALAKDTLTIARTLAEEAERLEQVDPNLSGQAVDDAMVWIEQVELVLGAGHA